MVAVTITGVSAVLTIIVGILVLVFPKLLRISIGLYLIIIGLLQLFN